MSTPLLLCLALAPQGDEAETIPHREFAATRSIAAAVLTPDGKTLVAACEGNTLHAWDLKSSKRRWEKKVERFVSPAAGFEMAAGEDTVYAMLGKTPAFSTIDLATGNVGTGQGGPNIRQTAAAIACDPRDRWVWIGTDAGVMTRLTPGAVNAWSTRQMSNDGVTAVAIDAKGKHVAVGGADGSVRFVNSKSAKRDEKKVFDDHAEPITAIAWDGKGKLVVSGTGSGKALVHSFASGKVLAKFELHEAAIQRIAVDPKGKWIATADRAGTVHVWSHRAKGAALARLEVPEADDGVTGLAAVGKGKELLTAAGPRILIWDLTDVLK